MGMGGYESDTVQFMMHHVKRHLNIVSVVVDAISSPCQLPGEDGDLNVYKDEEQSSWKLPSVHQYTPGGFVLLLSQYPCYISSTTSTGIVFENLDLKGKRC
ncbi:hypothetical protein PsorP6_004974 [Peronosclerospora sorghi]|uniref:Uncharacterized protein n=1 Tax=Peronosclerospora sorghi TaxID=230839 RepID=A0ACC0W3A0_9STRA|nr:hypothetical protein PsorP6_004974 [Peronosclerospora sorghi]